MLKSLLTIAVRSLLKDKAFSTLNIVGLTIGITCSMLLLMYILDEFSYDRYHKNAANIYRIISNIKEPDDAFTWSSTQMPLGEELQDNYPEVKNAVRFVQMNNNVYKKGDTQFPETKFYLADSTVFDMFSYDFISGDPSTALDNPFNVVLTETTAKKYFQNISEVLGQSILNQQNEEFKVTGIIKDVPRNSHFRFDALVSRNTRPKFQGSWGNFSVVTYIQLPDGYDLAKMYSSLEKIIKEKVNPVFEEAGVKVQYELQPITRIHLYSKIQDEAESGGDISYIYTFGAVAAFMLIIACINYINLTTARSANRAKEVGIRKVMGSQRQQLIGQFITESVVVTVMALLLSLVLIYVLLPAFNTLANKQIEFAYFMQRPVLLSLLGVVLFTGILGGSYPAFYLSGFNPVEVLKGKVSARGGNVVFRKTLVVSQFALTIFMLICTLIVFDQLRYMRNKDLGFDKEQVLRIQLSSREQVRQSQALVDKLKQSSEVAGVGMAEASPGERIGKALFQVEDGEGKMVQRGVDLYGADYDFVKTLGMEIVAGRDFSRDVSSDTTYAVLANESMVKRMGWKDPIGKRFTDGGDGQFEKRVVGVIKDYHQNSLYDPIEPLIIILSPKGNNYVFVRTQAGDVKKSLATVEKSWKEIFPDHTFEYSFLDEDFDAQYKGDQKRGQIFMVFSALTIVIACLGLLGLAAFSTMQRTKEIGIRKVLGASVPRLVTLISLEFFILVGLSIAVAFPAAWYFANDWLTNFAFRIQLAEEWPTFLLSGLIAFVITAITVGFHVVWAAVANPVEALRAE
jgi:putative ABC transport system permease protein